ncbi:MAG: DUF1186 domain-containing protein [Gammaproteobacteria bacterium]
MIEQANGQDDRRSGTRSPRPFDAVPFHHQSAGKHRSAPHSGVEVASIREGRAPWLGGHPDADLEQPISLTALAAFDWVVELAQPPDTTQMNRSYSYPVSQLLTLGQSFEAVNGRPETWKGYAKLGVDNRHIPELIAVLADEALHTGYGPVPFAPVHAWRILGTLEATEALPALVSLLRRVDDDFDDWITSELPRVFSQMGAQSMDVLAPFAADGRNGIYSRGAACRSMGDIASVHPEQRERCLEILTTILQFFERNDQTLNTEIVSVLLDLNAMESIDLIREAYAKDCVDLDCVGDLEDVEIALGLRAERSTAPKRGKFFRRLQELSELPEATRPRTIGPKVGRNDPCPCGSGKKYKKCCLEA